MKILARITWISLILVTSTFAGFPKVEKLDKSERITIKVSGSEPGFWSYRYIFKNENVTIHEDKKLLGKIKITDIDAKNIDNFLHTVRRARKPLPETLGTPTYHILFEKDGNKAGEWRYQAGKLKTSKKPTLPLWKLRERIKK